MNRLLLALVLTLTGALGAVAQNEVVTVTWWTEEGLFLEHVQNTFVAAFNEAHPNIRLELIGQQNINDLLRTAFQAGEAPDILQTPGASFIAEYIGAGLVEPLSTYAAELGWEDKLLPWAYESGIINGELYSVPLTYESMVVFYNKSLFEDMGWTPPTNMAELNALAEAAVAAGIHPFSYGNAEWRPSNEHLMGVYLNNYAGPEAVYQALIGEKPWTAPEFVEATQLLKNHMVGGWYSGSLENYYAYAGPDMWGELVEREAAMMLTGTWNFTSAQRYFSADVADEWDWVPMPMLREGDGDYIYLLATGSTISINGQSAHKEAAVEVINFLLSNPKLVLETASGSAFGEWVVPLRFEVSDFPEGTDPRISRFFADFAEVTGQGRYGYTTWTFWPAKPNVHLWQAVELVWADELSVEDYLAEHQMLWDEARAQGATLPIPARD